MALFLKNHSVEKIKILGRWSSDAFLVYIRPQVLEWTNNMSEDMARVGRFTDLADTNGPTSQNLERINQSGRSYETYMAF